jgi:hypothetical protein
MPSYKLFGISLSNLAVAHFQLNNRITRTSQVGVLLDHLGRRPLSDFQKFLVCLREDDQGHIVDEYFGDLEKQDA